MAGERRRGGKYSTVSLRPAPKGRPVDPRARDEVHTLLGTAPRRADLLIEHLHRIQDTYGRLSADHLRALAAEMQLAPTEVYEVATFYHHFDVLADGEAPPPPVTVRVCESVSCHMAKSWELIQSLQDHLGARVRVLAAPCVGRCDSAPVVVVGRAPIDNATAGSVGKAVRAGQTEPALPRYPEYASYRAQGGYRLLAACVNGERPVDDVIATIEASGLRGLGGAGFPTAQKWKFVRAEPAPRIVAVNADEGEPGTFKDRYCLECDPHRVLEGMLIAAWVVGADDVFFYLRDEYAAIRAVLTREIAALEQNPPCRLPRIHLRRGAGAYICGEETSLIESIEGKRGEPRLRPPFPAQAGVFGRPTLVQNVETLYWLRRILEDGAEAFAGKGLRGHKGQRFFSVSGRVKFPGVYCAPNGITVRELIDIAGGMAAGHEFYAYLPGARRAAFCPHRWATCRSISARSRNTAASSAPPRSSSCRSRIAHATSHTT